MHKLSSPSSSSNSKIILTVLLGFSGILLALDSKRLLPSFELPSDVVVVPAEEPITGTPVIFKKGERVQTVSIDSNTNTIELQLIRDFRESKEGKVIRTGRGSFVAPQSAMGPIFKGKLGLQPGFIAGGGFISGQDTCGPPLDVSREIKNQKIISSRTPASRDSGDSLTESSSPNRAVPTLGEQGRFEPGQLQSIQTTLDVSQRAQGLDLLETALTQRQALYESASADSRQLTTPYQNLALGELSGRLDQANRRLRRFSNALNEATRSVDSLFSESERARFGKLYLSASDLALVGQRVIDQYNEEEKRKTFLPFPGIPDLEKLNPLARSKELAELFGKDPLTSQPNSPQALIQRLILFGGLTDIEREKIYRELKLAEYREVILKNGETEKIPILHNGYLLGGGENALDCSRFVASLLPGEASVGFLTTLLLKEVYEYLTTRVLPPEKNALNQQILKVASAFVPIRIYQGERLIPGDLLVQRTKQQDSGHVLLVRDFRGDTLTAKVIDARQSTGSITEWELPLSLDPPQSPIRYLRPGFFALRLKPQGNATCQYTETSVSFKRDPSGS